MKKPLFLMLWTCLLPVGRVYSDQLPMVSGAEPQPLLAQAIRLNESLSFLGSGLLAEDSKRLSALKDRVPNSETTKIIQEILDPYCIAMVEINPEARVKVQRGPSKAELVQGGWKSFLVKVQNDAGITSQLEVQSPNAEPLFHRSTGEPKAKEENRLSPGQVSNRFLELYLYSRRPLLRNLSGTKLEYAVLQIYSREVGQREAKIGFHVGLGTQDIGFRNVVDILFNIQPSVKVVMKIKDDDGSPTMAGFVITDGIERIVDDPEKEPFPKDYRLTLASRRNWEEGRNGAKEPASGVKRLVGIYPLPSRRLTGSDEYPDFFFQPQIYRADGEHVYLPPGTYDMAFTRGPEYVPQMKRIAVPSNMKSIQVDFQLKRWVHMAKLGWYSADHHVHAAGCSHYESPEEGVQPEHMWRQAVGEDLNIACALAWGPCWYHQKTFFTGKVHPLSNQKNVLRFDVEVSGFPSSHAGHVCLLRLKEDDYPGTSKIEEWPSWTLPVLRWAREQGGAVGYAHSGWGLEPMEPVTSLPNYVMPKMDGIGANEYIVTVAHNAVDFFSAGDTPVLWELNMWYHTLNAGFRTRISGETDFPCIFDDRVGLARSYAKLDGPLDFDHYVEQILRGRSYVSEGGSHLIDFRINQLELGTHNSELAIGGPQTLKITAKAAAFLPEEQDSIGAIIASRGLDLPPYWHIERARIGKTQKVPVELIVNGESVANSEVLADGKWNDLAFNYSIKKSSWIALRILPSAHTNPIFVTLGGKPIRPSKASAEWCRRAVDRCWEMKRPRIREGELKEAEEAYNKARQVYDRIIQESTAVSN